MKTSIYDLIAQVPVNVIKQQVTIFQSTLKELFNDQGFVLDPVKQEDLINLIIQQKIKQKAGSSLVKKVGSLSSRNLDDAFMKALDKWLTTNKVYLLDRPDLMYKSVEVSSSPKRHLSKLRTIYEKQLDLEQKKSVILGLDDPLQNQVSMKNPEYVKQITQKNFKLMTKVVQTFTEQQQSTQYKKLQKKDEISFEQFQAQMIENENKDQMQKTFYTENDPPLTTRKSTKNNLPAIDQPYKDDQAAEKNKSMMEQKSIVREESEDNLKYLDVKDQMKKVFDCMEFDQKAKRQFKKNFYAKRFNSEAKSKEQVQSQNFRVKTIINERKDREEKIKEQQLGKMYGIIPKASMAWKLEQIMTTKYLGEMPQDYKIKSYFDFNQKAKKRVDKLIQNIV